jgi:hypothetical protein
VPKEAGHSAPENEGAGEEEERSVLVGSGQRSVSAGETAAVMAGAAVAAVRAGVGVGAGTSMFGTEGVTGTARSSAAAAGVAGALGSAGASESVEGEEEVGVGVESWAQSGPLYGAVVVAGTDRDSRMAEDKEGGAGQGRGLRDTSEG